MEYKAKQPFVPPATDSTVRKKMILLMKQGQCSAKQLSADIKISEKEVYGHLEHIRKSLAKSGNHLVVNPAECKKCGFVFSKRERFTKPGRCPVCRGESVHEPLFAVEKAGDSR